MRNRRGDVKVFFNLSQDEDGFPPVAVESVWARKSGSARFIIENIPFYVMNLAMGDVITADLNKSGQLEFKSILRRSGNITLRVVLFDSTKALRLIEYLKLSGCEWESMEGNGYFAINSSRERLESLVNFLESGEGAGDWEYQQAN